MILDPASRYFHSYHHVNSGVQSALWRPQLALAPPPFSHPVLPCAPCPRDPQSLPFFASLSGFCLPHLQDPDLIQHSFSMAQGKDRDLCPSSTRPLAEPFLGLHNPPDQNLVNKILCKQLGGDIFTKSKASWENKTSLLWHVRCSEMRIFCLLYSDVTREEGDGRGEW